MKLLSDVLGVQVSLGALSAVDARVSEAVQPALDADREGNEWRAFINTCHARFGSDPVGSQELVAIALDRELLAEVIGDKSLLSKASRLVRALHVIRDRQFGTLRVELVGRSHNLARWRVVPVSSS